LDISDVLDSNFNLRNIALNFARFAEYAKEHKGDIKSLTSKESKLYSKEPELIHRNDKEILS
jgi:hypothetical protein